MRTPRTIAAWLFTLILALAAVVVGLANVTLQPLMVARFTANGYPVWFVAMTGAIELFGALLVLIPQTAYIGAGLLGAVALGAIVSSITHGGHFTAASVALLICALVTGTLRGWGRGSPI